MSCGRHINIHGLTHFSSSPAVRPEISAPVTFSPPFAHRVFSSVLGPLIELALMRTLVPEGKEGL